MNHNKKGIVTVEGAVIISHIEKNVVNVSLCVIRAPFEDPGPDRCYLKLHASEATIASIRRAGRPAGLLCHGLRVRRHLWSRKSSP